MREKANIFYLALMLILIAIGFKQTQPTLPERSIATDCESAVLAIINHEIPESIARKQKDNAENMLAHYRFKNTIWNKIINTKDFENFDEDAYFKALEIYRDPTAPFWRSNEVTSLNPSTIEQKLALIEAINLRFTNFNNLPSIKDEMESLNAYKLRKISKMFKKFDLSKNLTRVDLEDFTSDFFLLLKGPPVSLLDYFSLNKTAKMNARMLRVLEEDMLTRGLFGTLDRIPLKDSEGSIERARLYVSKIMKYKFWRVFVLPYDLPWIDQVKISDELLEAILVDGLDAHQSELILELKAQNAIDHYERFRKAYRPVAFGVGFYFYYQRTEKSRIEIEDKNAEEAKHKFMEDFKKLADTINSTDVKEKSEEELKEIQLQRVVVKYREKYHEDPSPEEYREMRSKIFN